MIILFVLHENIRKLTQFKAGQLCCYDSLIYHMIYLMFYIFIFHRVPIRRRAMIENPSSGRKQSKRENCPLCEGKHYTSLQNHFETKHGLEANEAKEIRKRMKQGNPLLICCCILSCCCLKASFNNVISEMQTPTCYQCLWYGLILKP